MSQVFLSSAVTSGKPGSGTAEDPLNASTPDRLDPLMRGFPESAFIEFQRGLFLTTGGLSNNDANGWKVKDGWNLKGNDTTIRQVNRPKGVPNIGHGVFEAGMYDKGGVTIDGFTIDENFQGLEVDPSNSTFAVGLYGDDCIVRNIITRNGYGSLKSGGESFSITIRARHDGIAWQLCKGGLIEDCEVTSYLGDYGIAIAFSPGADGFTGAVKGIIRRCTVNNFIGTAAFGLSRETTLEDCRTSGCRTAAYADTGKVENVIIRGNRFLDCSRAGIHLDVGSGAALLNNLLIEGNEIEVNKTIEPAMAIGFAGSQGPGHQFDLIVRNNRLRVKELGPVATAYAISAAHVTVATYEDNVVDAAMQSQVRWDQYPSLNVVCRRNQTPDGGVPVWLEEFPV